MTMPSDIAACIGHRRKLDGALLGLCILCARQFSERRDPIRSWIEPAARQQRLGGEWVCDNVLPMEPAGA